MKKFFPLMLVCLLGIATFTISCEPEKRESKKTVAILSADGLLTKEESFFLSQDSSKHEGYYYLSTLKLYPFNLTHSFSDWGFGFGFTYTNLTDKTTPGYSNLSAITGKGQNSATYFTVSAGGAAYNIPASVVLVDSTLFEPIECFVTNSTYAYLAIKDKNDGGGDYSMVKEWTEEDKFMLIIKGYLNDKQVSSVEFALADGLNIIDSWQRVDLTPLGKVSKIVFELTSTDTGEWGMNTPSYFCLDRLKVAQ